MANLSKQIPDLFVILKRVEKEVCGRKTRKAKDAESEEEDDESEDDDESGQFGSESDED